MKTGVEMGCWWRLITASAFYVLLLSLCCGIIKPVHSFSGLPSSALLRHRFQKRGDGRDDLTPIKKPGKSSFLRSPLFDSKSSLRATVQSSKQDVPLQTHPNLFQDTLANGLSVYILPNAQPQGQFEAHLEILSGSAHELENQQGMAHLLEHIVYMGNKHRYRLSGTGSRTNAYTDFQHTVFFAACPLHRVEDNTAAGLNKNDKHKDKSKVSQGDKSDSNRSPLFPIVLDCFRGIFKPDITSFELEKERAAVLSEMSMINTHDYRAETNVLQQLHKENRISRRFPIGKEDLINAWSVSDVQLYHRLHYRPDNAKLFIVGDIDSVRGTYDEVNAGLGDITPYYSEEERIQILSREYPPKSMATVRRNFPPLVHRWAVGNKDEIPDNFKDLSVVDEKVSLEASLRNMSTALENSGNFSPSSLPCFPFLFKHAIPDRVSVHIFGKHPIEPIVSIEGLRKELITRMIMQALHIRLMIEQRSRQLFDMIEIADGPFTREACALTSIDLHCGENEWREALRVVGGELRRMGAYGITSAEFDRYRRSFRQDSLRAAEQSKSMKHEELLTILMESEARGDVFSDESERATMCAQLIDEISREEINARAKEMFAFLNMTHIMESDNDSSSTNTLSGDACVLQPSAVVVGVPNRTDFNISPQEIFDQLTASFSDIALESWRPHNSNSTLPFDATTGTHMDADMGPYQEDVPTSLFTYEEMEAKYKASKPHFVNTSMTMLSQINRTFASELGFEQLQLSNGMRVNICSRNTEPCVASVQVLFPGGQLKEPKKYPGLHLLGCKTLLEGGGFGNFSKEAVEMFCVDHMLAVDVQMIDDALVVDAGTSHSRDTDLPSPGHACDHIHMPVGHTSDSSSSLTQQVSGLEAVFQVLHVIVSRDLLRWENETLDRARSQVKGDITHASKDLDTLCRDAIVSELTNNDPRFLIPTPEQLDALTLNDVKSSINSQIIPSRAEVTVCGDAPVETIKELVLKYLGTLPTTTFPSKTYNPVEEARKESPWDEDNLHRLEVNATSDIVQDSTEAYIDGGCSVHRTIVRRNYSGFGASIRIELPDPEPRAVGFIAGIAPNIWGEMPNGRHVIDEMRKLGVGFIGCRSDSGSITKGVLYRALASVFENILSRRLFTVVREQRHLTYDANFNLQGAQGVPGGYYVVSVTSSREQIDDALEACVDSMRDAIGDLDIVSLSSKNDLFVPSYHVMQDTLQSSKMSVLDKHRRGIDSNMFWMDVLSGSQHEMFPRKEVSAPSDFEAAVSAITMEDVQLFASLLFGKFRFSKHSAPSLDGSGPMTSLDRTRSYTKKQNVVPPPLHNSDAKGFGGASDDLLDRSRLLACVGVTMEK